MDDGTTGDEGDASYVYQVAALLCFLLFADNLLERIEELGRPGGWAEIGLVDCIVGSGCSGIMWPASVLVDGSAQAVAELGEQRLSARDDLLTASKLLGAERLR